MRKTLLFAGLALCLLADLTAAAASEPDPLSAATVDGTLILTQHEAGGAELVLPSGQVVALALPAEARLSSLAALDDGWMVAGSVPSPGGLRLHLLAGGGDGDGTVEIPAPAARAPVQRGAVLVVDGGRLAGIAWLEGTGPQTLSVRAAVYEDGRFGRTETVSSVGPGTQTALAGTVLADGSWLLAWTAFDGTDDEVVFARRSGEQWLPVRQLSPANDVPDITPAVTAAGSGALVAWSRYENGAYRTVLSRFDGHEWSDPRPAGPRGSLYPGFSVSPRGDLRLLYAGAHESWSLVELDDAGREARRAAAAGRIGERPVVVEGTRGPELHWPRQNRVARLRWLQRTTAPGLGVRGEATP